jgi:two-component system, sensor histidine kinase and response regulator
LLEGVKILFADDNKVNQKLNCYLLRKFFAETTCVDNGMDAIELLRTQQFDVILLDLYMPGMDGYETAKYIIEEMGINIPIIAVTADAYASASEKFLASGMSGCITKPISPDGLKLMLSGMLNKIVVSI